MAGNRHSELQVNEKLREVQSSDHFSLRRGSHMDTKYLYRSRKLDIKFPVLRGSLGYNFRDVLTVELFLFLI